MSFKPVAENEEAGLVIRGNDKNHYDFLVTKHDGEKVVMMRKYLNDEVAEVNYEPIPDGDVILGISATPDEYSFWVKDNEDSPSKLVSKASTKNLSNEVISGFTGVYVAMYASGNGKDNTNPADFDWFEFVEKDK